jgi:hypothetical protein
VLARGFGRVGRPGLLGTMARTAVVAGTATAVSGGMMRRQERRAQQQQEASAYEQQQYGTQQMAAPPPPPPAAPPPATGTDQLVAQLKELGDLKDRGILTEAEFEQQKARLLAR